MFKNRLILFLILIFPVIGSGQEICDNGIDDDNDGLIDLNDTLDCDCAYTYNEAFSLIPNPSFEDTLCCPTTFSEMNCAQDWIQASDATSDYINNCSPPLPIFNPPDLPLPNNGSGYVGFISASNALGDYYNEYVGTCLNGPMLAGTSYTISFYTAAGGGDLTQTFSIFGTPDCSDLPWTGFLCPTGNGQWQELASQTVTYSSLGPWQQVTLTFTPTVDINAIALGGPCSPFPLNFSNYYFFDELTLDSTGNFTNAIEESGNWCLNNLELTVSTNATNGTWQWYLDGVALIGETTDILNVMNYGSGEYAAVYFTPDDCIRINYEIDALSLGSGFEMVIGANTYSSHSTDTIFLCDNEIIQFNGLAYPYLSDSIIQYNWDFGNQTSFTGMDTTFQYQAPGTYNIILNSLTNNGCNLNDSIILVIGDISTGAFIVNNEACAGAGDGSIVIQNVNGDSGGQVNITWIDPSGGTFATQTVNSNNDASQSGLYGGAWQINMTSVLSGCQFDTTVIISVGSSIPISTNFNHPQCFGTSNGSITAFSQSSGTFFFSIEDNNGNLMNNNGTNTANNLPAGIYTIKVSDDANCENQTTVILIEPPAIDLDLSLQHPLCHGYTTGQATVTNVHNYQGDFDDIFYAWDPNPNGSNGLNVTENNGLGAGEYVLEIVDDVGCSNEFTFYIIEPDPLIGVVEIPSLTYCRTKGFQKGNGEVTVTTGGPGYSGTGNVLYHWKNLENGDESNNTTFIVNEPGWMEVTLIDDYQCTYIEKIYVDSLNPMADFDLISEQFEGPGQYEGTENLEIELINQSINFSKESYQLSDSTFKITWFNNEPGNENGNWFFRYDYNLTKTDTILTGEQKYEICLVAKNFNDCRDTICKIAEVHAFPELEVPNIFTPGASPNNTFFFPNRGIEIFDATIFNRYGVQVFHFDNIDDQWNGNDAKNGKPCLDGVYFYTYSATSTNGTYFSGQGNVHLIRAEK